MEEQNPSENEVRRLVRRINNGVNVEFPEQAIASPMNNSRKDWNGWSSTRMKWAIAKQKPSTTSPK